MHLTTGQNSRDGRGDPSRPTGQRQASKAQSTLDKAAKLLGVDKAELKQDETQNIRGSAALLAEYARSDNGGKLPADLGKWYTAVARFGDMQTNETAGQFADTVYQTLRDGAERTLQNGDWMAIAPRSVSPDKSGLSRLGLWTPPQHDEGAECPVSVTCEWVPARFAQNDPDNIYDFGNYDYADREEDLDIKYIVIHTTQGSYESAINWYQDPRSYVSAHYTVRSSDGEVTQSVKTKDVAWHAGNWYINTHSIGIEHEGFAEDGAAWYSEAMYRSSAALVRYLAGKYNIPLDREHIVGHDQYHAPTPGRVAGMHWDPGPYWDWNHYMNLLHRPTVPTAGPYSDAVTIAPKFRYNKPPVSQCDDTGCHTLPEQPANFVYVRTAPNHSAPLVTDAGLQGDGSPSTTQVEDWGAKATHGQRFAVADRRGEWTAIWFNGQKGWIHNPGWLFGKNALPARAKLVTPKNGLESIPVYGRPWPEAEAYPDEVPFQTIEPLQYTISAGQSYVAYDKNAVNDYFHVWTFDRSGPGDGQIVVGGEVYIPISFSHRQAFVKASDVEFAR